MDMDFISMLIIGAVGVALGMLLGKGYILRDQATTLVKVNQERTAKKHVSKEKVLALIDELGMVANDDIEKLLDVSDATATNYLTELEQEGKIKQHGVTGRSVFYTPKRLNRSI